MKSLRDVKNFGAIAAEDDDLERFFVQTPVYRELLQGERQVVVGRKGSGKTALYLTLVENADGLSTFARGLAFSDYPWALHARYAHEAKIGHERFLASWRFLTFIEIFKILLTDEKRESRYKDEAKVALRGVEKFMQANWGKVSFDHKETFPSGGFKLSGLSVEPQFAGFSMGGANFDRGGSMGETLERLNEWLWKALQAIGKAAPNIYVLFDELDSEYTSAAQDYMNRVIGLLLAVRRLTRDFRRASLPFHAIAFLRSDIYDELHFGDKNKLTQTNVAALVWNDDLQYYGSSLKQLIDHRIREALVLMENEDPWPKAFDADAMDSLQHKFSHMTARTYLRPRDVIQFANIALSEYRKRAGASPAKDDDLLIRSLDIVSAGKAHSEYLVKELDDEIATTTPMWKDYMEVLRRIREVRFTRQVFEEAYGDLKSRLPSDATAEGLLSFFYRYCIIGFQRATGSGVEIRFRYQDESIRFDPDARVFMVHPGLKEALELADTERPANWLDEKATGRSLPA